MTDYFEFNHRDSSNGSAFNVSNVSCCLAEIRIFIFYIMYWNYILSLLSFKINDGEEEMELYTQYVGAFITN